MKQLYFLAFSCCFILHINVIAQSVNGVPQKINYSATLRDANNNVVANHFINCRFTFHQGSGTGTVPYIESQTTTTNPTGIFTVVIGGGGQLFGTFNGIPWDSGPIFLQVEIDVAGGSNFSDYGTTQLVSSPYAITAGDGVKTVTHDSTGNISITTVNGPVIKSTIGAWLTSGNASMSAINGYIGTSDNYDLILKRNGLERLRLINGGSSITGNLGVGVTSPSTSLDVKGALALRDTGVTVSGNFTLTVGNHSYITITSTVLPANAVATLTPGLVKGQILYIVISNPSATSNGVRFVNTPLTYKTRLKSGSDYKPVDGAVITFLWTGTYWLQV